LNVEIFKIIFWENSQTLLFFSKNKIFDTIGQTKVKVLFYFFLTKNIKNKIKKSRDWGATTKLTLKFKLSRNLNFSVFLQVCIHLLILPHDIVKKFSVSF